MNMIKKIVLLSLFCIISTGYCALSVSPVKVSSSSKSKKSSSVTTRKCTPAKIPVYKPGTEWGKCPPKISSVTSKRLSSNKKEKKIIERPELEEDIWSRPYIAKDNGKKAENHPQLAALERIHELQKKLLTEGKNLTEDERREIIKQITYLSRPLRRELGRVDRFPYFSEIARMDTVVAALVGKNTNYSAPDMSAEEILEKIQRDQYNKFESYLRRY